MYRQMIPAGYIAANGYTFNQLDADRYNRIQERINTWCRERGTVPESLLDESHKTFCLITGMTGV